MKGVTSANLAKIYSIKIKLTESQKFYLLLYRVGKDQYFINWEKFCEHFNVKRESFSPWLQDMRVFDCNFQPPIQYGLEYNKIPQVLKVLNLSEEIMKQFQYITPVLIVKVSEDEVRLEAERKILKLMERIN
jgi:hypothetical protein